MPSENISQADLGDQNNRLKEALRRLQSLHVTTEKNLQSSISKYEEDIKILTEENEILQGYKEKAEELQLQLDLQQEEMKELAQVLSSTFPLYFGSKLMIVVATLIWWRHFLPKIRNYQLL